MNTKQYIKFCVVQYYKDGTQVEYEFDTRRKRDKFIDKFFGTKNNLFVLQFYTKIIEEKE